MRVLLIEDDTALSKNIELLCVAHGIVADICSGGEDGIEFMKLYEESRYDAVILDLMLPDIDGYQVLKQIRDLQIKTPVIILSGLGDSEQKIRALGFGADDYLTKPFDQKELIARIKAVVRRTQGHSNSIIRIADLAINLDNHSVSLKENVLHLTTKEWAILEILALKAGKIVTKESIYNHLYNEMCEPDLKVIDVFVCRMRKKIYEVSGANYIETLWGRGYSIKSPDEIPESQRII